MLTSSDVNPKYSLYLSSSTEFTTRLFRPLNRFSLETRNIPVSTPNASAGLSFKPPDIKFLIKVITSL